jgi:IS30 family transposase
VEQAGILERLKNRDITQRKAAALLNRTVRWTRIMLKRYKKYGIDGLVHGNSGKVSKRKVPIEYEKALLKLVDEQLADAGPKYLSEKLKELDNIALSRETVRSILIKQNRWKVKQIRSSQRARRERKTSVGAMIQLDGSNHDWFEGRARKCTLLVFIDDATSALSWLEFVDSESTQDIMIASQHYFEKHGLPQSFYVDYGSAFSVNLNNPDHDKLTQFERAMQELGIQVIHAKSPQAKGRVERANKTLQDRLVKEMRLRNISCRDVANNFVQQEYMHLHNKRFAVKPASPDDMHRPINTIDLSTVLCLKNERILQNDYVVKYQNKLFQLHRNQSTIIRPKERIMIHHHFDNTYVLFVRQTRLNFTEITHKFVQPQPPKIVCQRIPRKPHDNSQRWVAGLLPSALAESRVKPALPAVEALFNPQKRN